MKSKKDFDVVEVVNAAVAASGMDPSEILNDVKAMAHLQCHYIGLSLGINNSTVSTVLLSNRYVQDREDISEFLARKATCPGPWVQLIMSGTEEELAVAQAVMDSWVWQIKRKMSSTDPLKWGITDHIMPILVSEGSQGDGKSYLLDNHIKPQFKKWMCSPNIKMDALNKHHDKAAIADYYVLVFDEMAGAGKTQKDALKAFITENEFGGRGFQMSYSQLKVAKGSCIGTSNVSIRDLLPDNSGMRRFFEIAIDSEVSRRNRSARDAYPWGQWIASIDVNSPDPKAQYREQLSTHQKTLVHDSVKMWVDDTTVDNSSSAELYEDYIRYCKTNGLLSPVKMRAFKKEVLMRGWEEVRINNIRTLRRCNAGDVELIKPPTLQAIPMQDVPKELCGDPNSLFNFVVQSSV